MKTIESFLDVDHVDCEPMGEELCKIFVEATLLEMSGKGRPLTKEIAEEIGPIAQILWGRLQLAETPVTLGVGLVVSLDSEGVPGNAVMWAYTLNRLHKRTGKLIKLMDLALAFPIGFPTEAARQRLWTAQKGTREDMVDNWLDQMEPWQAPLVEKPPPRRSRKNHLAWAINRARNYLLKGESHAALASLLADLEKHPETRELAKSNDLSILASAQTVVGVEEFISKLK